MYKLTTQRLSFRANMTERNLPNILTEIIDGFFFIEILLKFFVALRKPDGTLITNRTLIAMTYFKYWIIENIIIIFNRGTFLLDVIALLPYQYFSGKIAILKLFRVIHLNNIFERMGRLTEIVKTRSLLSPHPFQASAVLCKRLDCTRKSRIYRQLINVNSPFKPPFTHLFPIEYL